MKKSLATMLAVSLAALAGCASTQIDQAPVAAAAPPQTMRGIDVAAADPAFAEKAYLGRKPGLQQPIDRSFREQPPLVPHALTNFDDISLEENQCLTCHSVDQYKKKSAPKIGDSHLVKGSATEVAMSRYQCTTCHVAQVDAKPLVENSFAGNAVPK